MDQTLAPMTMPVPAEPAGPWQMALDFMQAGGPTMYVLLAFSVIGLAIILLKLGQFAAARIGSRKFIEEALSEVRAGRVDAALSILHRAKNPIARVMETALWGEAQPRLEEATVREETARVAGKQLETLRGHLRGLEVIASLSPLLGLFGTVLGMIAAFQQLQDAGSRVDPAILSGGIWEALLTTAAGLAVAIPAVLALNWLERIIDRLAHDMEDAVTRVFTADFEAARRAPRPVAAQGLHAAQ